MFSLSIADLCHHLAPPEQDAKEMDFGLLSAGNPEIDLGDADCALKNNPRGKISDADLHRAGAPSVVDEFSTSDCSSGDVK
jgi:hypothetical protein